MARTLLTLVLLTAVSFAQSNVVIEFRQLAGAGYQNPYEIVSYQYDKLRQGTAEYIAVDLNSPQMYATPAGKDPRVSPATLEVEALPGFQISRVLYPDTQFKQFPFDPKPFRVFSHTGRGTSTTRFRFKIHSLPDVKPGSYAVKAHLKFQLVNDSGVAEPQQLDVEVKIDVADRKAKVQALDRSIAGIRGVTPAEWCEGILLLPVEIPLGIFMALIGWDGC